MSAPDYEDYLTEEQLAAWRLSARDEDVIFFQQGRYRGRWYGEVRFYEWRSNERGAVLVRESDLGPFEGSE